MRFAIHRTAAKRVRCFLIFFIFWRILCLNTFYFRVCNRRTSGQSLRQNFPTLILDAILAQDPKAHVACEVTATTGIINVMGEISTECYVDIPSLVRDVIKEIGYDDPACGFDGNTCAVTTSIDVQSPDIAMGVNEVL